MSVKSYFVAREDGEVTAVVAPNPIIAKRRVDGGYAAVPVNKRLRKHLRLGFDRVIIAQLDHIAANLGERHETVSDDAVLLMAVVSSRMARSS